jgi:two-component system sensor histidine kinase KdpD
MVPIDIAIFEQALFNLLDNAAKYAPRGSQVRIRGYRSGRSVAIEVEDEGPGIPPDQLERIFDKFHRASEGDNRAAGTGLGLSICRGFVEGMGGRIAAVNRADRSGARFTITLPVPENVAADNAPASVA